MGIIVIPQGIWQIILKRRVSYSIDSCNIEKILFNSDGLLILLFRSSR
jgi:hypothetical protein